MRELNFDSGLVTFKINGCVEVTFNPADTAFVERLYKAFDDLESKQEKYKAEVEALSNNAEVFDYARERDAEMRKILDSLFEVPVCDSLFKGMSVYAIANGLPVWMNFLMAIIDEVEANYAREQKAQNPRIAKYTQKYAKYQRK